MTAAPSRTAAQSDFDDLLAPHRITAFQVGIIAVCAGAALVDGFDFQAISVAAPYIAPDFGVQVTSFGPVFGVGLLGGLVGAVLTGTLGDRVGRRPALLAALAVMAIGTLLTPLVHTVGPLIALRFVSGLGLGGALPSVIALTGEYTRPRSRAPIVAMMFSGYPLGALISGLLANVLIPRFGWTSLFWVGGIIPVVLIVLTLAFLPESPRFLAMRQDKAPLERVLRRLHLPVDRATSLRPAAAEQRSPLAGLFTHGRALGTVLLWVILALSLLISYFLLSWIPIIARQNGIAPGVATLGVVMVNLGSIVGSFALGRLGLRFGTWVAILVGYGLGTIAIAAIGGSGSSAPLLIVTTLLSGFLTVGAQLLAVALCSTFYDESLRATGVGAAVGVGRVGAIIGPVLGGVLLQAQVPTPAIFAIIAAVSLVCAIGTAVLGVAVLRRRRTNASPVIVEGAEGEFV